MVKTLPTIRAGNLLPIVRWMEANNRPTLQNLKAVGLDCWFNLSPIDSIPFLNAIKFLRNATREEGPDLPFRIVNSASIGELGYIGRIALGSRTPREAMSRVSFAMPMHASHEDIRVSDLDSDMVVTEVLHLKLDDECLNAIHCLLASMVRQICLFSSVKDPSLSRVKVVAHPEFGIEHMKPWLGNNVEVGRVPVFEAHVRRDVADRSFRLIARDRTPQLMQMKIPPLAEDKTLVGSIRPVLVSLLHSGEPTIDTIAKSAGMSVRSFQRRLGEEKTTFSAELETVRERLARKALMDPDASIKDVSERLGYSSQSALTRAVRRMTGSTPARIAMSD